MFGQIKDATGIHGFLLRGIEQVEDEWKLICLTHNILKLWRKVCGDNRTGVPFFDRREPNSTNLHQFLRVFRQFWGPCGTIVYLMASSVIAYRLVVRSEAGD